MIDLVKTLLEMSVDDDAVSAVPESYDSGMAADPESRQSEPEDRHPALDAESCHPDLGSGSADGKGTEKLDPKKLIIYSEIMNPKYK